MELDSKKLMLEKPKKRRDRKRKLPPTEFSFIYTEASKSKPILMAPSGRYAIQHSQLGTYLFLFDLYFKQRIIFQNPSREKYYCVALFDDFRVVLQIQNELHCYLLDVADRKPIKLNRSPKFENLIDAFPLDSAGSRFLIRHRGGLHLYELDQPFGGVQSEWKCRPIPFYPWVKAARLSDDGTQLWLLTRGDVHLLELGGQQDLSEPLNIPFSPSARLFALIGRCPLPIANDEHISEAIASVQSLHFVDDRHLVGVTKFAPIENRCYRKPVGSPEPVVEPNAPTPAHSQRHVFALRLQDNGLELMAERPLQSDGNLLCGGGEIHQITVKSHPRRESLGDQGTIVHMEFHRPQPLLLIAHKAAMQSGRKFELPPMLPIRPLVGEVPYKA